jgi:predicted phage tail protein
MPNLTIKLLGSLGRRFGHTHQLTATRLSEGISYLRYQYAEFESAIVELNDRNIRFSVVVQTATTNLLIDDPTGLNLEITQDTTLIISPVPIAAGDTTGKFLLGVGLIAFTAFVPFSIGIFGQIITSGAVGLAGAGLVLGSIISWLSPQQEVKNSAISPTIGNNTQGNPIQIVYGRRFITPQVISGGSRIDDISDGEIFRSKAQLQIVDALGEGEIKGLVNGGKSIWLNDVPLLNNDNGRSYQGVDNIAYRYGSQTDTALPAPWNRVLGETTVNQKLTKSIGPVIRRINSNKATNINAIKVRLYWDRLIFIENGEYNARVVHGIAIREGNNPFVLRIQYDIRGKTNNSFEREFELSVNPAPYYEIKVERYSQDENNNKLFSLAYFKTYSTVLDSKLKYPNTAKIAFDINLEKFGATDISRSYEIDGLKILIPDNCTVRADGSLNYTGIWTGTFQRAWSSDPAWCLYDLLINARYGCDVTPDKLDKYAFYACSAYCAALISDGYGGQEPRFNLNAIINSRESAYSLIQKLCSVFNAIVYYEAGNIVPVVDRPLNVTHQFTNANATFSYAGTAYRNRRNRAVVKYTRAEVPNSTDYEIYEDKADILKRGVEEVQIDATSTCTSRGQAQRIAKWTIYSEQAQKESISIQTGIEGALVRPGEIIQVGDRDRAGIRRWGRIKSTTLYSITLDAPIDLPAGNYTITCTLPDGTLVERSIVGNNDAIDPTVVSISPGFLNQPEPQSTYLIAGIDLQPTLYRVISRAEPETYRFEIIGLLHEPSKYGAIENGLNLAEPPRAVTIPYPPLPPQNLALTLYNGINISIGVAWDAPTPSIYTTGYQVTYTRIGNPAVTINTSSPAYLITLASYGEYEVQVRAIDTTGNYSGYLFASISIDLITYFATCYLDELTPTIFASSLKALDDIIQPTNFSSTQLIQPEPQTNFSSTEVIRLLN